MRPTGVPRLASVGLPIGALRADSDLSNDGRMRVNLSAWPSGSCPGRAGTVALTLSIRPACGIPGEFECPIDSAALLRLLRQQTDLPDSVIEVFGKKLRTGPRARLLGVELSERALTDIGYFID
jgi:hypothetical protein